MSIIQNYNRIVDEVTRTAVGCNRNPEEIEIVAVSKTFPVSSIQEAVNSGIEIFGESRIQEARSKIPEITGNAEFHLIGQLQSNKCREAVKLFELIHSIEKISTARVLNKEAAKIGKKQKILIQVKTSFEETKAGADPEELKSLAEEIMELENISLTGIMTIAPFTENTDDIRRSFSKARSVYEKLKNQYGNRISELSMGMSGDYQIAIEEGSTMIRVGSAIFGKR